MLKKDVPPFVAQMREIAELFIAEQPELDKMEADISELLRQFYIKSATYSLMSGRMSSVLKEIHPSP